MPRSKAGEGTGASVATPAGGLAETMRCEHTIVAGNNDDGQGQSGILVVPFLLVFLLHLKPLLALFPKFISTIQHISNKLKNEHQWNLNETYHFCKLFVFVYYRCILTII
jgi:hypothetical protein